MAIDGMFLVATMVLGVDLMVNRAIIDDALIKEEVIVVVARSASNTPCRFRQTSAGNASSRVYIWLLLVAKADARIRSVKPVRKGVLSETAVNDVLDRAQCFVGSGAGDPRAEERRTWRLLGTPGFLTPGPSPTVYRV